MKTFKLYRHPALGVEAVKQGFSWPAFFFGILWMLFKRLWAMAAMWFIAYAVLAFFEAAAQQAQQSDGGVVPAVLMLLLAVLYMVLWLLPAFRGNAWRERKLLARGYQPLASVQAKNPDAALAQAGEEG